MGRTRATRIIAAVMAVSAVGFGLFTAVFGIVSPDQEPHAVHNAVVASLLIVLSAPPVVAIVRDPERPMAPLVILAAVGVAAIATMALSLTLDPFTLPFVVLVGVLWAVAPRRGAAFGPGRPSLPLAALSLVVAVGLAPYALEHAGLQRTDTTSEHDAFFHWVEVSFYVTAIPMLGMLAAYRPVEYRLAGWSAGIALLILGAASLLLQPYPSALFQPLAWGAVVAGGAYVALIAMAGADEARADGTVR